MDSPADKVAFSLGVMARGVFWILALYIVGSSVWFSLSAGDICFALGKFAMFPVTYFVSPFMYDQVPALIGSWVCYVMSTVLGRIQPVG